MSLVFLSFIGEFQLRLRQLEKNLLQVLNDSKGQILDDDSVITTLETLKKEAADISLKVQETDKTMNEIEMVSQQYLPLSSVSCIWTFCCSVAVLISISMFL